MIMNDNEKAVLRELLNMSQSKIESLIELENRIHLFHKVDMSPNSILEAMDSLRELT